MVFATRGMSSYCAEMMDVVSEVGVELQYLAQEVWKAVKTFFLECALAIQDLFGCTCISSSVPRVISSSQRKTVDVLSEEPTPELCKDLRILQGRIGDIPTPLDLTAIEQAADKADLPIDYNEILGHFNQHTKGLSADDEFCTEEEKSVSVFEAKEALESSYITYTNRYRDNEMIAANVKPLIKGILFELRKPDIAADLVKDVLIDLVRAGLNCTPGRYTAVEKTYRKVTNQIETVDQILLQSLQGVKEDLFLAFYDATTQSVHTLNKIRSVVGLELGLDCSPVNLGDVNIGAAGAKVKDHYGITIHSTRKDFLGTFHKIYTPENILRAMQLSLNGKIAQNPDLQVMFTQYLDNELREKTSPVTDELLKDHVDFSRQCQLKMEGVKYLLVHHDFLGQQ